MTAVKDRTLDTKRKIEVYWNLHDHRFSVRQGGLVVAHVDRLCIRDVTFRVQQAGRLRVLEQQRKNVHAFVGGYYEIVNRTRAGAMKKVSYNPYKDESFVRVTDSGDRIPIASARWALLTSKYVGEGEERIRVPEILIP